MLGNQILVSVPAGRHFFKICSAPLVHMNFLEKQAKSFVPVIFPPQHFWGDPASVRGFLFPAMLFLLLKKLLSKITTFTRTSLKNSFPEDLERTRSPQIRKHHSQGVTFAIISCQRVEYQEKRMGGFRKGGVFAIVDSSSNPTSQ